MPLGADVRPLTSSDVRVMLRNTSPVSGPLHVIAVVSNPCEYRRRYDLARQFITRFQTVESCDAVLLYVVELAYGSQAFAVTEKHNPRHLQVRTDTPPLWHKENMINMGVRMLLPPKWAAFAWIDADVEFESDTWATDTLAALAVWDTVQLFSHAVDLDAHQHPMSVFSGFGYNLVHRGRYEVVPGSTNYSHPGFAWAMTRAAYDRMGGLYEHGILGNGDHHMVMSLVGRPDASVHAGASRGLFSHVAAFARRCKGLTIGYVPGVIRHYFHGAKANRKYVERWSVYIANGYNPWSHVGARAADGLLVPSPSCPPQLCAGILRYFRERNEDEGTCESVTPPVGCA